MAPPNRRSNPSPKTIQTATPADPTNMTNLLPAAFQSGQPLAIWPAAYDGARQQFETSTLTLEQVTAKVPVSLASGSVRPEDRLYLLQNGAAVIRIDGVMTNRLHWPGFCCSNVVTAYAVRQAARDEEVKSILIVGSSPGGTVLGLEDLHRDVKDAASQKPTTFFVDGYACSAAYYVACATSRIVINRTGWTGSLGSMMVQTESKGAYDQMGIKVHVFSTGPLKGQGTSGTELSEAFKSEIQRLVDSAGAEFASVISDGRKMDPDDVAEVFTGGVFTAPEALRLRLVDAIGTLDDALADLLAMAEGADEDGGALDQSARSTAPTTPGASPSGQRVQPPAQPISAPGGQPGPAGTTQA
ncbi:S49 family peptidase, partial [bacterium]